MTIENKYMLTTAQKRQYIQAIAKGKISADQFKEKPERTFERITPITDNELYEGQAIVAPGVFFICNENNKQYTFQEIEAMAGSRIIFAEMLPLPQIGGVKSLSFWGVSAEEQIINFLNINKNNYNGQ